MPFDTPRVEGIGHGGIGFRRRQVGKQVIGLLTVGAQQAVQLQATHIPPASLGQCKPEGLRQHCGQGGQVFVDQLLLQGNGGGGNQHTGVARQRQRNGRCAVSHGFANACTRLDDGKGATRRNIVGRINTGRRRHGVVAIAHGLASAAEIGVCKRLSHPFGHLPLTRPAQKALLSSYRQVKCGHGLTHKYLAGSFKCLVERKGGHVRVGTCQRARGAALCRLRGQQPV